MPLGSARNPRRRGCCSTGSKELNLEDLRSNIHAHKSIGTSAAWSVQLAAAQSQSKTYTKTPLTRTSKDRAAAVHDYNSNGDPHCRTRSTGTKKKRTAPPC